MLRWKVGTKSYVAALEHRIVDGVAVGGDLQGHHRNGVKSDNRRENIEYLTCADHAREHGRDAPKWGGDVTGVIEAMRRNVPVAAIREQFGITDAPLARIRREAGLPKLPKGGLPEWRLAKRRETRTHCPHDHEFTPENTYYPARSNERGCRKCRAAVERARKAKIRALKRAS